MHYNLISTPIQCPKDQFRFPLFRLQRNTIFIPLDSEGAGNDQERSTPNAPIHAVDALKRNLQCPRANPTSPFFSNKESEARTDAWSPTRTPFTQEAATPTLRDTGF